MRLNCEEWIPEARRILALAWPVILTNLNWTLLHLIDVAVVGRHGTHALGELAAGRSLTYVTIVMGLAWMSGVLVFAARADGAGDHARAGDQLRAGLLWGALIGCGLCAVLLALAEPLLDLVGVPPDLAPGGASVVRALAAGYPAQFVQVAAAYFLEGISRPRRVTAVNLVQLPINALLAWAWVGGHLGLPAWGAAGAGAATSAVTWGGAVAMTGAALLLPDGARFGVRDFSAAAWGRAARGIGALARFGLVPAVAAGLELAGFSWLIVLSTQLGAVTAAAFQTVFSLYNIAFALALGFGSAAGVRVGNAVGAGELGQATPRAVIACALAAAAMALIGILFLIVPTRLVASFSTDAQVILLSASLLGLLAPAMAFDGIQIVLQNALRARGDQVMAGVNTIAAFFLVTSVAGWALVRSGFGAPALIYALVAGIVIAAILQSVRLAVVSRSPLSSPGRRS